MRLQDLLPSAMPASPANIVVNSAWCGIHRTAGYMAIKDQTVNPGGAGAQTYNQFTFSGEIQLVALYGTFTSVANVVTVTAVSYDLYDGTNTVPLTSAAGTNCSGVALMSAIAKTDLAANAITLLNANQVRINEISGPKPFQGALFNAKYGVTNYLRLKVTTDAATNCAIRTICVWVCRYPGSTFAAV